MKPVLNWSGGKRQILCEIEKYIPKTYEVYYEPFLGGGAVLFHLQPKNAVVNDINAELMNLYKVIKCDVKTLIADLRKHKNEADYFYAIRRLDRNKDEYNKLSGVEKASRIFFLNKTCYGGLFRVNQTGEFNSSFGKDKNPNVVDDVGLVLVSNYFNRSNICFKNVDFVQALEGIEKDAFVYFDPPYDPISKTGNFIRYTKDGFDRTDQCRLKDLCDDLNKKGVKFLLSNSATEFIQDLYKDYRLEIIKVRRSINSKYNPSGKVDEVLVRNY